MEPNGNVTYYNVSARWEKDSEDFIEQRNYCLERQFWFVVDLLLLMMY